MNFDQEVSEPLERAKKEIEHLGLVLADQRESWKKTVAELNELHDEKLAEITEKWRESASAAQDLQIQVSDLLQEVSNLKIEIYDLTHKLK